MTERIIEAFAERPIPAGGCTESGRWVLRAEALYSTGSVTIEKRADIEIMAIPIQQTVVLPENVIRPIPIKITHVAMLEANCTTGTNAERKTKGAYPWACCMAWPHS